MLTSIEFEAGGAIRIYLIDAQAISTEPCRRRAGSGLGEAVVRDHAKGSENVDAPERQRLVDFEPVRRLVVEAAASGQGLT